MLIDFDINKMPHSIDIEMYDKKVSFPNSAISRSVNVKLHMGPYEANGFIRHKEQRLRGLKDSLTKSGYNVEIIPTVHLDRLSIEMHDREIFRCNIRNFQFNMPAEQDPYCMKVLEVLKEHANRFCKEKNVPAFDSISYGMRCLERNKFLTTPDRHSGSDITLIHDTYDGLQDIHDSSLEKDASLLESSDSNNLLLSRLSSSEEEELKIQMSSLHMIFDLSKSEDKEEREVNQNIRKRLKQVQCEEEEAIDKKVDKKPALLSTIEYMEEYVDKRLDILERSKRKVRRPSNMDLSEDLEEIDPILSRIGTVKASELQKRAKFMEYGLKD